jgi:hypothetical protein
MLPANPQARRRADEQARGDLEDELAAEQVAELAGQHGEKDRAEDAGPTAARCRFRSGYHGA